MGYTYSIVSGILIYETAKIFVMNLANFSFIHEVRMKWARFDYEEDILGEDEILKKWAKVNGELIKPKILPRLKCFCH